MESPVVEFTVAMSDFKRKVRATALATIRDITMPSLEYIKVTVESGQVMLVATDRYKVIATRLDLVKETSLAGSVLLNAKALKYLGMMGLGSDDELTVRVDSEGLLELKTAEETLSIRQSAGNYPPIENILFDHLESEVTGQILGFDPNHLDGVVKSFKTLHPKATIVIQGTPTKRSGSPGPAMVFGNGVDDWVALLMPMRIGDIHEGTQVAREAFTNLTRQPL